MKFEQNWLRASEKSFENVNGRTDDRQKVIIAHPELKKFRWPNT